MCAMSTQLNGKRSINPWSGQHTKTTGYYFAFNTYFSVKMFSFFPLVQIGQGHHACLYSFRCDDFLVTIFYRIKLSCCFSSSCRSSLSFFFVYNLIENKNNRSFFPCESTERAAYAISFIYRCPHFSYFSHFILIELFRTTVFFPSVCDACDRHTPTT